jgi:hypothetical protein
MSNPAGSERHTFTVEVAGGIAALTRLVHVLHGLNFCPDRLTYGPAPDGGVLLVIETTQPPGGAYTLARRLERVVDTRSVVHTTASSHPDLRPASPRPAAATAA